MHALRRSTLIARLVVAWFVLTLGVAISSPIVNPQGIQSVCADGGVKTIVVEEGAEQDAGHHTLDCPMCLTASILPPPVSARLAEPQPLMHALQLATAARRAPLVGAPLPPRGPPIAF